MPKAIPIFRDHDEVYRADACVPLVNAAARGDTRLHAVRHGHYPGVQLPAGALPGISTIGFWDAEADQQWGLPWHRNEGIELTFLESGRLDFSVDGRDYLLGPDDLTITRPWQRHRVGNPNVRASRLDWLIIDLGVRRPNQEWRWPSWILLSAPDLDELTRMLRDCEQPVWRAGAEVRRAFKALGHYVEMPDVTRNLSRISLHANELFLSLLEMLRVRRVPMDENLSSSRRTVGLFLADLREHPEHLELEWSVESMAESCGLGVTQFVHHVRSLTNMSPAHYLRERRLEYAVELLRQCPALNVTEVAQRSGFSSSQYFATAFSRRYGRPPSGFTR